MKRFTVLLSLFLLLSVSACTVFPGLTEIANSTSSDPRAGTPIVSVLPAETEQPASQNTDVPEVVVTPAPIKTEPAGSGVSGMDQGGLSGEKFDTALIQAIEAKDFTTLRSLMGERFVLAYWRSEGNELSADQALADLGQSVLSSGATPAASTGVDTSALLEGADPLAFFPPDAVRAVYFDFVGPAGTDQALAIIGRDPNTGARYWKGMLVAWGGFRQTGTSMQDLNEFSQALGDAVLSHDFTYLHSLMNEQFAFAKLDPATRDGSLTVVTREEAIHELRWGLLSTGSDPVILWNTDIPALLSGNDPLEQWGPSAAPVRAVHFTSMSTSNQAEAVLVIGREPSGRLYWHGILTPLHGETFTAASGEPVGDARPTDVRYVVALDALNVRSGPGTNYAVEGRVREGEVARVSGISPDGQWWQIYCTQDASGRCWVSADPSLTQPTGAP